MNIKAIVKKYTMVIALVVVFIFFTALTGGKLIVAQNVSNLLLQNAYVLVMACGMLLCILTGGNVDLSIGSSLCLSGALAAKLLQSGMPTPVVILASLAVGCVIGCWQGYLIGYIHIPPFICKSLVEKLASLAVYRHESTPSPCSPALVPILRPVQLTPSYLQYGGIVCETSSAHPVTHFSSLSK